MKLTLKKLVSVLLALMIAVPIMVFTGGTVESEPYLEVPRARLYDGTLQWLEVPGAESYYVSNYGKYGGSSFGGSGHLLISATGEILENTYPLLKHPLADQIHCTYDAGRGLFTVYSINYFFDGSYTDGQPLASCATVYAKAGDARGNTAVTDSVKPVDWATFRGYLYDMPKEISILQDRTELAPGTKLSVALDGSTDFSKYPSGEFQVRWERKKAEQNAPWVTVQIEKPLTDSGYTVRAEDCGCYLSATLINNDKTISCASCGTWVFVYKLPNTETPVKPILDVSGSYLIVKNASVGQEYAISVSPDLTADDLKGMWSQSPTANGDMLMNGALPNSMNYVYTRNQETERTLPGSKIAVTGAFVGYANKTQALSLSYTNTTRSDGEPICARDVLKITAVPIPADASDFTGVLGNQWSGQREGSSSSYLSFFEDEACTRPVSSTMAYKTVYARSASVVNNVAVKAVFNPDAVHPASGSFTINIAGSDGLYKLEGIEIPEIPEIRAGTVVEGVPFYTVPEGASTKNLSFANPASSSYKGLFVNLSASKMTLTINATNCDPGIYNKELRVGTTKIAEVPFTVVPNTTPVEELKLTTHKWNAAPEESFDTTFDVIVNPSGASGDGLVWTSSNTNLATVKAGSINYYGLLQYYGAVHFTGNAKPGEKVTITVKSGSVSDTLVITFVDPDDPGAGLPCDGGSGCPGKIFKDMPSKSNWAHDAIDWAVVNKVTSGTSANTFSPGAGCTRAQVVTFLWRAAGEPEPSTGNNPFIDLKSDEYYYKAVLWAVGKKITTGTSANRFSPDTICSRAQIVTFLWRFEGEPAPKSSVNPFRDVKSGEYYEKAVLWAAERGVTTGTSAVTFSPDSTCTRDQIVTFLYRDIVK